MVEEYYMMMNIFLMDILKMEKKMDILEFAIMIIIQKL